MTNCTQFRALLPRVSSLETQLLQSIRISNRKTNCPEVLSCHDLLNMPHSSIAQCKVGCCHRQTANPRRLRPCFWNKLGPYMSQHLGRQLLANATSSFGHNLLTQKNTASKYVTRPRPRRDAMWIPTSPHARDKGSSRLTFEECSTCSRKV